ncbi:hypothetical protein BZA77DRAFT_314184 [Pyronema omphalodes]|nr:hypothetical protein BZA77DRAFT_314184 [Pyronema omphalodes]
MTHSREFTYFAGKKGWKLKGYAMMCYAMLCCVDPLPPSSGTQHTQHTQHTQTYTERYTYIPVHLHTILIFLFLLWVKGCFDGYFEGYLLTYLLLLLLIERTKPRGHESQEV